MFSHHGSLPSTHHQIGYFSALPANKQCKICPAGTISVIGALAVGSVTTVNNGTITIETASTDMVTSDPSSLRVIIAINGTIITGTINGTLNGTITYVIRSPNDTSSQTLMMTLINNGTLNGTINATLTNDLDGKMYSIMNGLVLVINASKGTIKVINASAASGIYFAQFPGSSYSYTTGPSQDLGMLDLTGKPGADACFPCPAGFFQYAVGGSMCHPCPFGTYSSSIGSNNCTPCSPGTASARLALTTACPSCPANFYAKYDNTKTCM